MRPPPRPSRSLARPYRASNPIVRRALLPTGPGARGWATCVLLIALHSAACTDIREYRGTWTGPIEPNPDLREGFSGSSTLTLTITDIDRTTIAGFVTIGPPQTATAGFSDATLIPMSAAQADALGDVSLYGDSLATYLVSAAPDDPAEEHAILVISAFPDRRMEVRVLRHGLYGLFRLHATSASTP